MKRCFISIDIPENIKKEIIDIQENLPYFEGKKTEPENLHLTLKFLGSIENYKIEKVKEKLREIKYNSFETEIDSIGFFDNMKSKEYPRKIIVWLHLTNCGKFQKKIDESLSDLFEPEKRFMSHLTIARVKNINNKKIFLKDLNKIKIPDIKFVVDKFYLMESKLSPKGSKYSVLEKFELEKGKYK